MFERYTEKARRVIFFARYEASQFGGGYIEPEHLLLGAIRESTLVKELLGGWENSQRIRLEIESQNPARSGVSTSVDLPLSGASKRILAYGAEEAERLSHKHISELHLVLGILREEDSLAAKLLRKQNLDLDSFRQQAGQVSPGSPDIQPTSGVVLTSEQPFRSLPKRINIILGLADEEAHRLHQPLRPEHLLLGLLRHAESAGAKLLIESGLTLEAVRAKLASS